MHNVYNTRTLDNSHNLSKQKLVLRAEYTEDYEIP